MAIQNSEDEEIVEVETSETPIPNAPDQEGSNDKSTREEGQSLEKQLLNRVETYLKWFAAFAGIVAIMGFPSVYFQYSRLGIPTQFISRTSVIRAGIIPTIFLVLTGLYIYWAIKDYYLGRKMKEEGVVTGPLVIPLLLIVFLILFLWLGLVLGMLSLFALFFWGIGWIFSSVFRLGLSNRELLYAGGALFILFILAEILVWRLKPNWIERLSQGILKNRVMRFFSNRLNSSWLLDESFLDEEKFPLVWILIMIIVFPIWGAICGLAFRKILDLWDPQLLPWFTNSVIMIFSAVTAFIMGMFGAIFAITFKISSENRSVRAKGIVYLGIISLIIYLLSVGLYSAMLYPKIPQGLGGGRPTLVSIWMERNDFPDTLEMRITSASCHETNNIVQCDNLYLVYMDGQIMILVDKPEPPANSFLIPRGNVTNISW